MFYPDKKKAEPGDLIEFQRKNLLLKGKVLPSNCKNSIVVEITSPNDLETMNESHPNTVVAHGKYRIMEKIDK